MLSGLRVGVVIPAHNEADRLGRILPALPHELVDLVVVIADGCTDATAEVARRQGAAVIEKPVKEGPGPGIREGLKLLRAENVSLTAVMAANGKHDPTQVPELVRPLVDEDLDLVRGSRYLRGGYQVNMPWHRRFLIRIFTVLLSLAVGQRVTDGTGGFQAYRLSLLDDDRIDLDQAWLGRYEVETYLFVKTLLCGYRWKEIPVRITYPERGRVYTRARPVVDWWGYFRPVILLRLGLRR
jgi:dolichol-phosphate mannosyltransferase